MDKKTKEKTSKTNTKETVKKDTSKIISDGKDVKKDAAKSSPKKSPPKINPKTDNKNTINDNQKSQIKEPEIKSPKVDDNKKIQKRDSLLSSSTMRNRGKGKKDTKKQVEKELFLHFGKRIININNEEQDLDVNSFLKTTNIIGVLFTGSWCPPAKEFMPKLEELYKKVNAEEKVFEIIQISSERTEKDFKEAMTEDRNWLYVPFNDPHMPKLVDQFKIEYLPTLKVVNKSMYTLSENGRKDIVDAGTKAFEKWYKEYRRRKDELEKQQDEREKGTENYEGDEV